MAHAAVCTATGPGRAVRSGSPPAALMSAQLRGAAAAAVLRRKRPSGAARAAAMLPPRALSDADAVAIGAGVFAGVITTGTWAIVSFRVTRTIKTRNLRTQMDAKLKALQVELLEPGKSEEEVLALKREVVKLQLLMRQMVEDADAGRAMQGRNQVPEVTPLTYMRKSLWSTSKDGRERGRGEGLFLFDGDPDEQLASAVTLGIILLLLTTSAFLP